MTFAEAIAAVLEGKRVRNPSWGKGWSMGLDENGALADYSPSGDPTEGADTERVIILDREDLEATDWSVVE